MVLPKRLNINIPPAITAVAEAAVGRDAVMKAVASAVLQVVHSKECEGLRFGWVIGGCIGAIFVSCFATGTSECSWRCHAAEIFPGRMSLEERGFHDLV